MHKPVFRKVAVTRLASPDQVDRLMQVTHPRGWLALFALTAIIGAALAWGIFGSIPTQINGQGILIATGGINTVDAPSAGQVDTLHVQVGDTLAAGGLVAEIVAAGGARTPVHSAFPGRVAELTVDRGSLVDRGTRLLTLVDAGRPLEAVIYLSATDGKRVLPGMPVMVSPSTVAREEYGYLRGTVIAVGELPSTYEGMYRVLKNADLVNALRAGGAPVEVRVQLNAAPGNASGYEWSSPQGPPLQLQSGTPAAGLVTIDTRRPLGLVLPFLR